MRFSWRPDKEHRNIRKHGLDFSFAVAIFADPWAVTLFDRIEDDEEASHTIGCVAAGPIFKILLVVYTYPDPDDENWIRVISLREADPRELRHYENEHH